MTTPTLRCPPGGAHAALGRPGGVMMRTAILALALLAAGLAHADDVRLPQPPNPDWRSECGSCHVAYPPALLDAASWRRMMQGLDRHFGANASLDEATRGAIAAWLERHAAQRRVERHAAASGRITDTAWLTREHREVAAALWKHERVGSPANCGACHGGAEEGSYRERELRMPGVLRGASR